MAVRFKFRSSPDFDSVDIEGRPSISIRDLKSKIVRHKNLDICQDFDLVFSDALTGQEYSDEKFQIPSGSSVIIKRVPAGSAPSNMVNFNTIENVQNKPSKLVNSTLPMNVEVDDFDDFGIDLYPVPEATFSGEDLDADKNVCTGSDQRNDALTRCLKPSTEGCQRHEESDLSEAIPRDPAHCGAEGNMPQKKSILKVEEDKNLERVIDANPPAMQNAYLPSELKCSLCDSFFKEAVMIPCCQHSFCQKCIRLVLLEKRRCPKCLSTRCRVEDLLPNVSLRQAIEHFLESQILNTGSGTAFCQYAPDGESGIQAKDVSCGVTILQREPEPYSPTATGRGSNQIMLESTYDLQIKNNTSMGGIGLNHSGVKNPLKASPMSHKINKMNGERHGSCYPVDIKSRPEDLAAFDDFQGESLAMHEEAESSLKKKKGFWVNNAAGGDKPFMESGRYRKGDRTCFMCGSPDHFIRDCPDASSPHPLLQRGSAMFPGVIQGYVPPYWNGTSFPHIRPFGNIYGNAGMMPFNAAMVPAAPYAVPNYMPSVYGGFPSYSGYMPMGGVAPPRGPIEELHQTNQDFVDFQNFEKRRKISNENMRRELSRDDYENDDFSKRGPYNETERSHDRKSSLNRERSVSYSEDSFTQRSQKKHQRDNYVHDNNLVDERCEKGSHPSIAVRDLRSHHHTERSSSEVEDMPSSPKWHSKKRRVHHHTSSEKHSERRDKCGSDSSRSHHQTYKEKEVERKRNRSDIKRQNHKRHSHAESGLDQSLSSDRRKQRKETSHTSRRSHKSTDDLSHDRWQMVSGSNEDGGEDYHSYKRKRGH
ncbi:E3 ubiquitin ligase PQT3-like isoform X1 [Quercus robur]|uniref:E3 ubiquitin ligase PQT3-like isoform X1 n=1 Tax=Quercus robur TaxID=38942 RepID=UPI0021630C0D|nr:E3 ubiquitin ligase PQT3-like isoform X1 [Quercus robur]XP_050268102.1 E3 ubiquitin ligase PQT3-like isoform X1 [Quercus robur]